MWIPNKPGDLEVEYRARCLVEAVRDMGTPDPGRLRIAEMYFKTFDHMNRVAECLVERYGEGILSEDGGKAIRFNLLH